MIWAAVGQTRGTAARLTGRRESLTDLLCTSHLPFRPPAGNHTRVPQQDRLLQLLTILSAQLLAVESNAAVVCVYC